MLRLQIKYQHPNPRHIRRAAEIIRSGGLVVYPTDTTYGMGCDLFAKRSIDRIYRLKGLSPSQQLAFVCADLSEVSRYAVVENRNYRILRHHLPGKYTFVLPATRDVPKNIQSKRRQVGIRIPDSPAAVDLVREVGHPLVSTTVARQVDGEATYSNDPDEIADMLRRSIDVMLDAGPLYEEPSTVVDLTQEEPLIVRRGSGDVSWLGG